MQLAVTPQLPSHADIRSAEILAAVRQTFVEKGFDGASMQDLARAAGMSVGNFYRYFPSKAAIIQALIHAHSAEIQSDFAVILTAPHPLAALRHVLHGRVLDEECIKDMGLWTEIEAAIRRSPDIARAAQGMQTKVIDQFLAVFAAETNLTLEQANRHFSALAAYVLVMVKAASCLSCGSALDQNEVRSMILRSIDLTLDDVAAYPKTTAAEGSLTAAP